MVVSLPRLRGMILCQRLHDCTSVATEQVRKVNTHLKGWYKHPIMYRGVPKAIQPFLESGVPTPKYENNSTRHYGEVLDSAVLGLVP